jgi:general secretion pathway protein D
LSALPAAAAPILSITPASQTVNVGDTVTVNVDITDVLDLFAYQFDVAFDPSILSFQSIVEGSFPGGSTFFFVTDDPLTPNTVELIANAVLGPIGVNGSGTLAIATFTALMAGAPSISLTNLLFYDSTLNFDNPIAFDRTDSAEVVVRGEPTASVPDDPSLMILLAASLSLAAFRYVARVS